MHIARLRRSADRLLLADFDPQEMLQCLVALLKLDRSWLPPKEGYSMYIRPFMFADSQELGVHPPSSTRFNIVLSPVGPYFSPGEWERPGGRSINRMLFIESPCRMWLLFSFWITCTHNLTQPSCHRPSGAKKEVSLFLDETHVRAWPGGAGDHKLAGNYAATVKPQVSQPFNTPAHTHRHMYMQPKTKVSGFIVINNATLKSA